MRLVLKNTFGTKTGYHYSDDSPLLVGDRITIRRTDAPATVRVRVNGVGLYYYVTYSIEGVTYSRSMEKVAEEGFSRCDVPKHTRTDRKVEVSPAPERLYRIPSYKDSTMVERIRTKGDYILTLLDYDTAIYGNI